MPKVQGLDHVAIVVEDLDVATKHWVEVLGLRPGARETVETQGVEVQILFAGDTRIELVCPLSDSSPVAKFLEKKGPGIHHLALKVDNTADAIEDVLACGEEMIHTSPQAGVHQTSIAFVHPKSACGVLLEWVEDRQSPDSEPKG
jgi:methylmalonyl-CoA epimerase